jgi:hypothetical protein
MYTTKNFKTKAQLKAAVAAYHEISPVDGQRFGNGVTYFQPGPFAGNEPRDGTIYVEGPHFPEPHRWYAACTVKDGVIVKVNK